ncbi:MAG: Ltp family lipoprotein [Caldicoprobacterales bacterium]
MVKKKLAMILVMILVIGIITPISTYAEEIKEISEETVVYEVNNELSDKFLEYLNEYYSKAGIKKKLENDGFSPEEIESFLEEEIEGFIDDEDWKEHAFYRGLTYLEENDLSKEELIELLKEDGFTDEEIQYAIYEISQLIVEIPIDTEYELVDPEDEPEESKDKAEDSKDKPGESKDKSEESKDKKEQPKEKSKKPKEEKSVDKSEEGGKLPKTATNGYLLLFIGLGLFVIGYILFRQKKHSLSNVI